MKGTLLVSLALTMVAMLPMLSDAAPQTTFADAIGVGVHFDQGQPLDRLQNLVDLGVRWVRDSEPWSVVEAKPGVYTFPERLDQRLAFYKAHNIGIVFTMCYSNPTAYPDDVFNAEAFGKYAAAVARKLKDSGVRFALEIWNEPHNFEMASKLGGNWNAAPPSPWVDHYLKMTREVVKQVKAVDPSITLMTDEDVYVAHYWFLEQGLPKELDAFALHPYTHGGSIGPEQVAFTADVDWAKPFTIVDADRSYASVIRRLRDQAEKKMGKKPDIWVTEWGYTPDWDYVNEQKVGEDLEAAFVPRAYITSVAAGVKVLLWHTLQDMGDGPLGLLRNDLTQRKAYQTFKTMATELGPYTLVKQLAGTDHPTSGLQAYLFKGPLGYKLAAWNIGAKAQVTVEGATLAPPQITSMLGERIPTTYLPDGPMVVTMSDMPVYITGINDRVRLKPVPQQP